MDGRPCGELVIEPFAVCYAQADAAVRCRAAQLFGFAGNVFAVDVSRDGVEKDIVMDADPVLCAHPLPTKLPVGVVLSIPVLAIIV